MYFVNNYNLINNKITKLSKSVNLIVVTKNQSISNISKLVELGHLDFGENKVQEAIDKWSSILSINNKIRLHFIGKLQSNKAKQAFSFFHCIHSLDNKKLAKIFSDLEGSSGTKIKYFIQVNIGNELQKSGVSLNELPELVSYCITELKLNIVGLMCIPPVNKKPDDFFVLLRSLNIKNGFNDLSMGMSSDFEKAIEHGSTFVRVGSAIFKSV
jgi:pyridoxal phosphate enzyme (YggS family)